MTIKLSLVERRILANQYRILEKVDPDEAKFYKEAYDALESGYTYQYPEIFVGLEDELSIDDCKLVWNSMAMYSALQDSAGALPERPDRDSTDYTFPGFDGNNETVHMAYARYIRDQLGRFSHLDVSSSDLNSHTEMLPEYRRMVNTWINRFDKSHTLDAEGIAAVLGSRRG